MWYKLKRIYVWSNLVRPKNVQTFDFQNNGQQWWSSITGYTSTAIWGFTNWEGYYFRSNYRTTTEAWFITMPNTLPNWTLTRIKIWYYLPGWNTWAGINDNGSTSSGYNWGENSYTIWFGSSTAVSIGNYTWELTTEYNITPTWCSWTCAWQPFSFTNNEANNFITAYNNKNLRLYLVTWGNTNNCYLRKIEITTT
jgi:hypothetical protein